MRFVDWLKSECDALDECDRMERGEIPPGPVEFRKASDGSTFFEFVKRDDNGAEYHLITNDPDGFQSVDPGDLIAAVNKVVGGIRDLEKRVDGLVAERKDCIEVSSEQLAELFGEALNEAAEAA